MTIEWKVYPAPASNVDRAVSALRAFNGNLNRRTALTLLTMWAGFPGLTPMEVQEILDRFPAAR